MNAAEFLKVGQLSAAIEAATQDVKGAPGNVKARILLFELLSAAGQWERAQKHLDVVSDRAGDMQEGVASYRGLLDAERQRARLFTSGEGAPQQVTPTPLDLEPQLTALRSLQAGDVTGAARLMNEADEQRPPRRGTIDGTVFENFRDADDLLASVLEVLSLGRYGWIPLAQIRKLEFQAPQFFRDLLWIPTVVTLTDGFSSKMFVPARYAGSEDDADDQIKLGRATDWQDEDGLVQGKGQRAFLVGDELRYIADMREVVFEG